MKLFPSLVMLGCSVLLQAQQISFQIYNDYFAGTDKLFTSGLALSWLDNSFTCKDDRKITKYSQGAYDLLHSLHLTAPKKRYTAGISLIQYMITPPDTTKKTPQYDQMPYAGYAALSFYTFVWDTKSYSEYRMTMGVVGHQAGGAFVQKNFHRFIGDSIPQGWDTQIKTRWVVNVLAAKGYKTWQHKDPNGYGMDWGNHFGARVGTERVDAFASSMFRIGKNYVENFNTHYPYLQEQASLLHVRQDHHGFGYAFSAGVTADILAYSYILREGQREGYATTQNSFNTILFLGTELFFNNQKLTFFYQAESPYVQQEKRMDIIGSLVYSYQF